MGDSLLEAPRLKLQRLVTEAWSKSGNPDLVVSIERYPQLLEDRSLLLDLAIEEFRIIRGRSSAIELDGHCHRFGRFGNSIEKSIFRQLETQMYLDDHPELLDLIAQPDWPNSGDEFGNFVVVEELGRGGIARVYLCQQCDVGNRQVVVKATPFLGFEAAILGRLSHPNIVPIHSTGTMDERGLTYICMPYLGRSTLADLLDLKYAGNRSPGSDLIVEAASRSIPSAEHSNNVSPQRFFSLRGDSTYEGRVLDLAVKIADALAHAHARDILHGDLKPTNVLLTPAGEPLLMDFNLSQDHTEAAGFRGGTLPYMPPELLAQVVHQTEPRTSFDPKSDIYSFGVVLYELLTGETPVTLPRQFEDISAVADGLYRKLEMGIRPIRQFNSAVGKNLEAVVLRCLSFNADERPATMLEVKRALEKHTQFGSRLRRQAHARPRAFFAGMGLALLLVTASAAYYAVRPPRYVAKFELGLELLASGDPALASDSFRAAVRSNPAFRPARFYLARTHIALKEFDEAIADFRDLTKDSNDLESMAYLGYCFNLKRIPVAAIPWYEQAISHGAESAAIYNNLGASYLATRANLSHAERFARAEFLLQRALQLDDSSLAIRLNLLRSESAKAIRDPSYWPLPGLQHAEALTNLATKDPIVQAVVRQWYGLFLQRMPQVTQFGFQIPRNKLPWDRLLRAGSTARQSSTDIAMALSRCYIEPDTLLAAVLE